MNTITPSIDMPVGFNTMQNVSMTLKEITDLLGVRHNDAMNVVEKMSESHEFGELRKIRTSYKNNIGAELPLDTYQLDKRQSMAVAAKLNVALLMRVIDRWQELESGKQFAIPSTLSEALLLAGRLAAENEAALLKIEQDKPDVEFARIVKEDSNTRCIRVWVKTMKHENNLIVGEREVFKWLVKNHFIFKDGNSYLPYAKYEANGKNYFTVVIDEINGKAIRQLKITGKGVCALTSKVVSAFYQPRNGLILLEGGAA